MAKTTFYINNPYLLLDGHDFSEYIESVEVGLSKDKLPTDASGDGGHTAMHGLSADSFVLNLYADKDYSILDRILYDHYSAETSFVVEVTSAGSIVSEANPSWTGTCKLFAYKPLSGKVGTEAMIPVTLEVQGSITRAGT